jgi:hypothetical protein
VCANFILVAVTTNFRGLSKLVRYVNIDYLFMSSMRHGSPQAVIASYDIACIWGINFDKRRAIYSRIYHPDPLQTYRFLVPKFHLKAHKPWCQVCRTYLFY